MSTARHHSEWMNLVEVSGPFLSLPVLLRVFPQGLDAHDAEHARSLRLAFRQSGPVKPLVWTVVSPLGPTVISMTLFKSHPRPG